MAAIVKTRVPEEGGGLFRRGRVPGRECGGAQGESAGPADREPGLSPAFDAQGLPRVRQDDGRDRRDAARAVLADRLRPRFASLADGKEVRKILADHGMKAESSHFSMGELRNSQEKSIEWAKEVGITQMITATLGEGNGGNNPTLDQVKQAADEYNKIAAVAAKAGIQQGLHNEGFELSMVDGKRTYDLLFDLLDPEAGQVPVPDVDDHGRPRRRRVLPEVPRPLQLDAPAGRGHERPGPGPVAEGAAAGDAAGDARRWRWARAPSTG